MYEFSWWFGSPRMNYLDVYFSRINHLGETTAERIRSGGIRSFEKWKAESPHTVRNLSVERGIYFDGIILTSKDKEYEKIMFLNVANDIPLLIGDIMNWEVRDGSIEKWIIIQEEKKVNDTYRTFWIVRCNYLMKWIDSQGHLQQSWSYFVSSLDSKIKGNFRTWNNLITPQVNKYAELLMPRYPIDRATNFIVEDESWSVVEYDHTSVPGIIYLSLSENKINTIYDNTTINVADTDKYAQYALLLPEEIQIFKVGDIIEPHFTLTKNGIPSDEPVVLLTTDKSIAKMVDYTEQGEIVQKLTAVKEGTVEIIVQLAAYPEIVKTLTITVNNEGEQEELAYIEGKSSIKLDRYEEYELKGSSGTISNVVFTLEPTNLAVIVSQENNKCRIKANMKNNLGTIILHASYNEHDYIKEISIVPLW